MEKTKDISEFTVIYSLPNSYDFYVHSADGGEDVFEITDFNGVQHELMGTSNLADIDSISSLELHFKTPLESTSLETYTDGFLQAYSKLNTGELEKIILSRIYSIPFETKRILDYLTYLKASNTTTFVYLVSSPEIGTWIGATPEKLAEGTGQNFKTMALAGTRPFSKESAIEWSKKEIAEHEIVVNRIENVLKKIDSEFLKKDRTNQKSGQVVHLKTEFEFRTNSISEFISLLHPSPAISGQPKDQALEAIKKIEQHNRSLYTGYLGFEKDGRSHYYVNLRCMQIFKNSASLYLGGGITKDSVLENEWLETEHKAKRLLQPLEKMQKFAENDF